MIQRPDLNPAVVLRRAPEQGRSVKKVQQVTEAAARLLALDGYLATIQSAAPIIEQARVTRSTFYTYFDSQTTVMEYLALEMLDSACDVADSLQHHRCATLEDAVGIMVDRFADYYRRDVVRELWLNQHISDAVRSAERGVNEYISTRMPQVYEAVAGPLSWTHTQALVAGQLVDSLMQFAFRRDSAGDPETLNEARRASIIYVHSTNGLSIADSSER